MSQSQQIAILIRQGMCDDDFDVVYDALKARSQYLAAKSVNSILPGSRVRTSGSIRPAWMAGKYGVVEKATGIRLVIRLYSDSALTMPVYYKGFSATVRIPANEVEVLSS